MFEGLFGGKKSQAVAVREKEVVVREKEIALSPRAKIAQDVENWREQMEQLATRDMGLRLLEVYRVVSLEAQVLKEQKKQGYDGKICDAELVKRDQAQGKLRGAMRALNLGFDPFTPPKEWYAGLVNIGLEFYPALEWLGDYKYIPFPSKNTEKVKKGVKGYRDELDVTWHSIYYFTGVIPPEVIPKYTDAREIFDWPDIHVYSPRQEDIAVLTMATVDPIMVGRIQNVPMFGTLYFRVATWGLPEDLKSLFEKKDYSDK